MLLCVTSMIFVTPPVVGNVIYPFFDVPNYYFFSVFVYWNLYSLNFVIYSASNAQYRRAFAGFIKFMLTRFKRKPKSKGTGIFFLAGNNSYLNRRSTWPPKSNGGANSQHLCYDGF